MTVSPPRTLSPIFTAMTASAGTNTSIRDPNFMIPRWSPARTRGAFFEAAHHAPRENADDLARDDWLTLMIDPDLAALVDRRRLAAVRRAETVPA